MKKVVFYVFILSFFGCRKQPSSELRIASASSLQFVMNELTSEFTSQTGIDCSATFNSSGKHTAQIMEGAPYDIFMSADLNYADHLYENGLATNAPKIYAYGQLVLWTQTEEIKPTIEILSEESINHIAVPNPATAPYGKATEEVLNYYGLLDNLKNKLVYGENVMQTSQYVYSGAAEIGFTAKSIVMSGKMKGDEKWIAIDTEAYSPISHGIVVLQNQNVKRKEAQSFYEFVLSEKGQEILNKFGYLSPTETVLVK